MIGFTFILILIDLFAISKTIVFIFYHVFRYTNKMNKNHLNSSMNNYLINASLFKNNQKNRMVSSYVSHRNYFAEEETPKHRN
jgi:hypothetical protein